MPLRPRHRWFALAAVAIAIVSASVWKLAHPPAPASKTIAAPVAIAMQTPPPTRPALDATSATILELFNPSDAMLTHQLNETELSQRVEQLLVTSFVLTRCGIISETDYADTYHAIVVYALRSGLAPNARDADINVRRIGESASASYALIYSRAKCDDPNLRLIADQLKTWRGAYQPKSP